MEEERRPEWEEPIRSEHKRGDALGSAPARAGQGGSGSGHRQRNALLVEDRRQRSARRARG
jgi:hypothetical protein